MRGLNPDQLRTFIEVVECGSFTAAAKRLCLTQPAVSLQIRELEARCGTQLILRGGKKPFPTDAGRVLLAHARGSLKASQDALAAIRNLQRGNGNLVRIGMTMTTLNHLARDVVRELKTNHPEIELSVIMSSSPALADNVRDGQLDLAIITLPTDETQLVVEPFYEDSVIGIVPEGFCTPVPATANAKLLASAPFVVQTVGDTQTTLAQTWFRANGEAPQGYIEVRSLEACRAAVAAGLGVSIVPGVMAEQPMPGLVALPLDPPVIRIVGVISHKDSKPNAHVDLVRKKLMTCRPPALDVR